MGEVLEFEAEDDTPSKSVPPESHDDIQEVQNYRKAMFQAETLLEAHALSQRVIGDLHKTLLSGVRGEGKKPGDYRLIANWIGPTGCTVEQCAVCSDLCRETA